MSVIDGSLRVWQTFDPYLFVVVFGGWKHDGEFLDPVGNPSFPLTLLLSPIPHRKSDEPMNIEVAGFLSFGNEGIPFQYSNSFFSFHTVSVRLYQKSRNGLLREEAEEAEILGSEGAITLDMAE